MNDREKWLKEHFQTILLATDFHQSSKLALAYAIGLARKFEGKVTVLNAFTFGPYSQTVEILDNMPSMERRNAEELLGDFTAGADKGTVIVEEVAVEGLVPSAVIKALFKLNVDLLVVGTEGVHKGLDHALLGSNTEAMMLGSHCPTLTVGPGVPEFSGGEISCRKILYISDFSIASTSAASFSAALSEVFKVEVETYQLVSKALRQDRTRLEVSASQYCDVLKFADPDLPSDWYDAKSQLANIHAEEELMVKVSEPGNLIVLGVQPASFIQRHLHTSLAYRLLANAASPVLTIPAGTSLRKLPKP